MKIRTGFVSNSSSSSFCIYGVSLKLEDFKEELKEEYLKFMKKKGYAKEEDSFDTIVDGYEFVEWIEEKENIEGYFPPDSDYYYFGEGAFSCPEDKTMGEWKKEIQQGMNNLTEKEISCSWQSAEWYDG